MNLRSAITAGVAAIVVVSWASHAWAQAAPPGPPGPPKGLSGSAGFGLSFTQGNTDTLTLNATDDSVTVAADTGVVSIAYADIHRSNLVGD